MQRIITPERSTARIISDQALKDLPFQRVLIAKGFAEQDDKKDIDEFRDGLTDTAFTSQERRIVSFFEPFGYLSTYSLIIDQHNLGHRGSSVIASAMQKAKEKVAITMPDSPVVQRLLRKRRTAFGGIGCEMISGLDPTDLALSYLLYGRGNQETSSRWIAAKLFPYLDPNDELESLQQLKTAINRLKNKLPSEVTILSEKRYEEGASYAYHIWKGIFS